MEISRDYEHFDIPGLSQLRLKEPNQMCWTLEKMSKRIQVALWRFRSIKFSTEGTKSMLLQTRSAVRLKDCPLRP